MPKIIRAKSSDIFPLIREILQEGSGVCITVNGDSMYPFLRNGVDSVELAHIEYNTLKELDIVLVKRSPDEYVLHRVIKKEKDCFYIVGDALNWIEGPLFPNQLIAVTTVVWRKEKKISCCSRSWRVLSWIWTQCLPVRGFLIRIFYTERKLKRILKIPE